MRNRITHLTARWVATSAFAGVMLADASITQAQYVLVQTENALRTQMAADLDPKYRDVPAVLTEPVAPLASPATDREKMVEEALSRRGDLRSARQQLDVDDLNTFRIANSLSDLGDLGDSFFFADP